MLRSGDSGRLNNEITEPSLKRLVHGRLTHWERAGLISLKVGFDSLVCYEMVVNAGTLLTGATRATD